MDWGSPQKFHSWRDGQDCLFWDVLDSKKRFSIHNAPVGSGKSPAYMTAAIAMSGGTDKRVIVITESKGLQDQLREDFGCVGLFDMRGLQNYPCRALLDGGDYEKMWVKKWGKPTCDIGPCSAGLACQLKNSGCDYFDDFRAANSAQMVSTNFAYWIAINKYGQGLGKFDWMIIDECHATDSQLSSAMSVEFVDKDFKELGAKPPKIGAPLHEWRTWGRIQLLKVQGKLEFFQQAAQIGETADGVFHFVSETDLPDASELKFWKRLEGKCSVLAESSDDWIIEQAEGSHNVRMAPAWVRNYAESHIFLNTPRIIMMSATVRPKIANLLGIPDDKWEFTEYPSTFPLWRRPIFWVNTVRLNSRNTDNELRTWVARIDQIISKRLDRKGIVHTVSYRLQQYLLAHSRFRKHMIANARGGARDAVKIFRDSEAPSILVSPSVGTGFDFPHDAARYQIIGKVPFRDARGAILQIQAQDDPTYLNYLTSQDLVQLYGRTNRSPVDFSETFILDNNIEWFLKQNQSFFPSYFLEAFEPVDLSPDPPSLEEITC